MFNEKSKYIHDFYYKKFIGYPASSIITIIYYNQLGFTCRLWEFTYLGDMVTEYKLSTTKITGG